MRGTLIEKQGSYDEPTPKIVFKQGNIVHLRKTIEVEESHQNPNIYVDESTKASIVALDTDLFRNITKEDKAHYYPRVWKKVASRVIILSASELGQNHVFKQLTEEAVKFFTAMCDIKVYGDESVDMSSDWRGSAWRRAIAWQRRPYTSGSRER